ncbi:MAG: SDR family oxidoreductase, partial [Nocardioidaceae bacterium]
MRWLVTGSAGMLGTDLVETLRATGDPVVGVDKDDVDLSDPEAARSVVAGHDVVVNCVAWTAVDAAEEHEDEARLLNAEIPRWLAQGCRASGARLVQISTDYVFDGAATTPYPEDAPHAPRSAYGRTKAAGEDAVREELPGAHQLVRTAWLYGAHGRCFPRTIARAARDRGSLTVVDDQHGQPTWTRDVADV